jgi:hypothetical protein
LGDGGGVLVFPPALDLAVLERTLAIVFAGLREPG